MSNWIRGTADDWLDLSNDLVEAATGNSISAPVINAAGTGYVVGDILTIAGGTSTIAAEVEVVTVGGSGDILTMRMYNAGVYTVTPSVTANAVTGGTGSSATVDLTYAANGWTAQRNTTWSGSEREVILEGSGGGTDEILVGWRTLSDVPGDYYNFELHGMTGYASALPHKEQPGISPGFHEEVAAADYTGAYLVTAGVQFFYFININAYRIIVTVVVGSVRNHAYLGWGNRFATSTEYPYPMVVAGSANHPTTTTGEAVKHSTLTDPWAIITGSGPMKLYGTDGTWYDIQNRIGTSPQDDRCVLPCQEPQGTDGVPSLPEDRFMGLGNVRFSQIIFSLGTGNGGAMGVNMTPAGDDDHRILLPAIIVFSAPSAQVLVELDEVFWCHSFGGVFNDDRFIDDNGVAYRIFQNCNRTDSYAYMAIKEAS